MLSTVGSPVARRTQALPVSSPRLAVPSGIKRPRAPRAQRTARSQQLPARVALREPFLSPAASPACASWTCQDLEGRFSPPGSSLQDLKNLMGGKWLWTDSGGVGILEKASASDAMILIIKSCASCHFRLVAFFWEWALYHSVSESREVCKNLTACFLLSGPGGKLVGACFLFLFF